MIQEIQSEIFQLIRLAIDRSNNRSQSMLILDSKNKKYVLTM